MALPTPGVTTNWGGMLNSHITNDLPQPGELVLHVKDFGAIGDGVTDDTAAWVAAIAELRAFAVTDPPLSRPVVISGHGGVYKITSSLNLTALTLGRGWGIRDAGILAACPGKIAFDFTGSRFGRLSNVHVWGDQTSQPHTGFALSSGAVQATAPCDRFVFDNVTVDGYFTSSALHLNAAEENTFESCVFANRRVADGGGESWAVILDGAGYKAVPSDYATPSATRSSFTVNKFSRCAIQKPFGIAGPTMFMQDLASISFESCYLTNGSGSGIVWRLTSGFTPYRVYMDFQQETTGTDRFIFFEADVLGAREIRGLECTFGNVYCDQELFNIDGATISTLTIRSFKLRHYRMATGVTLANKTFNGASRVALFDADVVSPTFADFNANTSFAAFTGRVTGLDGIQNTYEAAAWTSYTPALTNWTLGNGTLTGAFKRVGRTVHYRIRYTVGSTDTPSGNFVVSLPVATNGGATGDPRGTAHLLDTSAAARGNRFASHNSTTTVYLADLTDTRVGATTPWTWASGDVIVIFGSYEAVA